jgi:DNA-binding beta-propeller fold protein YncE
VRVDTAANELYVADGENNHVWMLSRASGKVLSRFGRSGRYAGQLHWVRNLAVDSRGNIYTAEVDNGTRVQKFADKGLFPITD